MKKLNPYTLFRLFFVPAYVLVSIVGYLIAYYSFHSVPLAYGIVISGIVVGSFQLIKETGEKLLSRQFALDYIALLAISLGVITGQYLVAAVIVLMLSGGNTLEEYGMEIAKRSLTSLTDRIPNEVLLIENGKREKLVKIDSVKVGQTILVRKGEVIPLDGRLVSDDGLTDESSLTGEPYMIEKIKGDHLRSGTINIGNAIQIMVTTVVANSTYHKIIAMVKSAQDQKAPLIRLADRYSTIFTIITFIISGLAYLLSHDFGRVLSVLVIATPCPLILATPIALMGGMNAAAKKRIIVKNLASIEALSRVNTIIFDKTGTITLGKPSVRAIEVLDSSFTHKKILQIAESIERHSLHPLAKAIIAEAKKEHITHIQASAIDETIGTGIHGVVDKKTYRLSKPNNQNGMAIEMYEGKKHIARFTFEDELKAGSKKIVKKLQDRGIEIHIFTGDKETSAKALVATLGENISYKADCTPEDKKKGIELLRKQGKTIAMVGDGINDAPALALADVGMVFSNEEQTAASEASDIIFLGGDFSSVIDALFISRNTIHIALQSIISGIGVSVIGMLFAAFGQIPAIYGAFLQEAIDVAVILNALRASKTSSPY
jgi:heavy metal translocating P-type ATPase